MADLSPFPADGLQGVSQGVDEIFFNAALLQHGFHGGLSTPAIHMCGGIADTLRGTHGIWEQPAGVVMLAPQGAQCLIGQIRKWDEPIFVPLAAPDMNQLALAIDIAHLQGQGLREAQAHGIGCQQKNPVSQVACHPNYLFNFGNGENIRQ